MISYFKQLFSNSNEPIGRKAYLMGKMALILFTLLFLLAYVIFAFIWGLYFGDSDRTNANFDALSQIIFYAYLFMLIIWEFRLAAKRFIDMGFSKNYAWSIIIPFINILAHLALFFMKKKPKKPRETLKNIGLVTCLYFFLGFLCESMFVSSYDSGLGFFYALFATPLVVYVWKTLTKGK
jgi:uncharacterized membrane protein YhaH (DUF805 family)